jgi:hypothetical protein
MDRDPSGRKRGKDKAKRTFEKYGKYTPRSLRIREVDQANKAKSSSPNAAEKVSK